ncbi:MAG: hypothetical protein OQJ81_05350 [Melioribacteraceae bacterium]|nr:hypothetical protein [Melioribacteraceae bacterium]
MIASLQKDKASMFTMTKKDVSFLQVLSGNPNEQLKFRVYIYENYSGFPIDAFGNDR